MKVTDYRPVDLIESDVMPIAEAAKKLGMTMPGVIRAIERGALTEVIDDDASYHARRLVLRKEVERLIQSRSNGKNPPDELSTAAQTTPKEKKTSQTENNEVDEFSV